jgi:hypothetical protein
VTTNLIERIHNELTASLGHLPFLISIHVREGWGDILFVTFRVRVRPVKNRDDLSARLRSAVAGALGQTRHFVEIKWER